MNLSEKYHYPQRLYTDMLCSVYSLPRYVSPVLASLVPYSDKKGCVRIDLATKRTLAYEVGISLDSFTKAIRLAEKHGLLEVINSLKFQLKPCLTDCKKVSLTFSEDGVNIDSTDEAIAKIKPKADIGWIDIEGRSNDEIYDIENELPF